MKQSLKFFLFFIYGCLTFIIAADATPIPTVFELTTNPDSLEDLSTFSTLKMMRKPPADYDVPEEGITQIDLQPEITSDGSLSEHENVTRDVVDFVSGNTDLDEESPMKTRRDKKKRASMASFFRDGPYVPPPSSRKSKFRLLQTMEGDKLDGVHHYIAKENKNEKKHFLFDKNMADDDVFGLFRKEKKRNEKTHFLFDDDIGEMKKLNFVGKS